MRTGPEPGRYRWMHQCEQPDYLDGLSSRAHTSRSTRKCFNASIFQQQYLKSDRVLLLHKCNLNQLPRLKQSVSEHTILIDIRSVPSEQPRLKMQVHWNHSYWCCTKIQCLKAHGNRHLNCGYPMAGNHSPCWHPELALCICFSHLWMYKLPRQGSQRYISCVTGRACLLGWILSPNDNCTDCLLGIVLRKQAMTTQPLSKWLQFPCLGSP